MSQDITEFKGEFWWLSNFSPSKVILDGYEYPSVEHAYQAAKTVDPNERKQVRDAPGPGQAKKLGRKVAMREDWEQAKIGVMESMLRQKFDPESELAKKLLETGDGQLVEGNFWGDTFWGVCKGVGKNNLGKLLMKIRGDLRAGIKWETSHGMGFEDIRAGEEGLGWPPMVP